MIDTDTIEKYILGGERENQYPQVIEYLIGLNSTKIREVKRLKEIIGMFDEFMCNNWTPENVHSLWNELLTKEEEE
tara:strand:- start:538 stop:765 length:228 start_codon:yes stop_codon:yes gene_type:complete